jgi:hypothetical protein
VFESGCQRIGGTHKRFACIVALAVHVPGRFLSELCEDDRLPMHTDRCTQSSLGL